MSSTISSCIYGTREIRRMCFNGTARVCFRLVGFCRRRSPLAYRNRTITGSFFAFDFLARATL